MTEAKADKADKAETAGRVWIADDDRSIRWVLNKALTREGIQCRAFETGDALLDALKTCADGDKPQALVSDVRMPGRSGLDLLPQIKKIAPTLPVIIMTAFTDLDSAVSSFQQGAFEYLTKPFDVPKAVALIKRAIAENQAQEESASEAAEAEPALQIEGNDSGDIPLIGQAPAMQEIFRAIGRLSRSTATVLLTGESGTGKEVVARTIWKHSPRSNSPFVAINVAAIPKELLESELFGHEKGAFTGAVSIYQGRFEQAQGGTLFLDEIGDMPIELQTRLLRVLSSGFFYRIAGKTPIKADVRIIAATNKNLQELIKTGKFREDLFYRLNVIHLSLPALRERKEDIPLLVRHFLRTKSKEFEIEEKNITEEALLLLKRQTFPGNVRELENLIQWFLVMVPGKVIKQDDLPEKMKEIAGNESEDSSIRKEILLNNVLHDLILEKKTCGSKRIFYDIVDKVERELISISLQKNHGNKSEAAKFLGIGRNTILRKALN